MALIKLKNNTVETYEEPLELGTQAPTVTLVSRDLSEVTLENYTKKSKILNIFPSVDTSVCATSVKRFIEKTAAHEVTLLNISADLPFAMQRFCEKEALPEEALMLSCFRTTFSQDYRVMMTTGPLKGLCARCVYVLDENNTIIYSELVEEITEQPNYSQALEILLNRT